MQPLGYLRKAETECKKVLERLAPIMPQYAKEAQDVLDNAKQAVKFVMPENGKIFDSGFKALPETLNLPFPKIVIEYECLAEGGVAEQVFGKIATTPANKRIVYAEQQDQVILVVSIVAFRLPTGGEEWQIQPYYAGLMTNDMVQPFEEVKRPPELAVGNHIKNVYTKFVDIGGMAKRIHGDSWEENAYVDMIDESGAVLSLIEALSCRNVGIEKLPIRKMNKSAAKRGAIPFDEYHVLTVTGQSKPANGSGDSHHRSPREHLRRGHIRRLPTGNTWVNSTVVNAGIGSKINKIYALETQ